MVLVCGVTLPFYVTCYSVSLMQNLDSVLLVLVPFRFVFMLPFIHHHPLIVFLFFSARLPAPVSIPREVRTVVFRSFTTPMECVLCFLACAYLPIGLALAFSKSLS